MVNTGDLAYGESRHKPYVVKHVSMVMVKCVHACRVVPYGQKRKPQESGKRVKQYSITF